MNTAFLYTVMSAAVVTSACAIHSADDPPQNSREPASAAVAARDSAVAAFAEQLREAEHAVLTVQVTRAWTREGADAPFEVEVAVARTAMSPRAAAIEVWASSADNEDAARAAIDTTEPAHFRIIMDGRCVLECVTRLEPFEKCYDARAIYLQAIGREQISEQDARQAWEPYRNSIPQPVLMPFEVGCMVAASSLGTMIGDESGLLDRLVALFTNGDVQATHDADTFNVEHRGHRLVLDSGRMISWSTIKPGGDQVVVNHLREYDWKIGSGETTLNEALNLLHDSCDCEETITELDRETAKETGP